MKSVRIRRYSNPHFPAFGLNNSEYGHFIRVVWQEILIAITQKLQVFNVKFFGYMKTFLMDHFGILTNTSGFSYYDHHHRHSYYCYCFMYLRERCISKNSFSNFHFKYCPLVWVLYGGMMKLKHHDPSNIHHHIRHTLPIFKFTSHIFLTTSPTNDNQAKKENQCSCLNLRRGWIERYSDNLRTFFHKVNGRGWQLKIEEPLTNFTNWLVRFNCI